MPTSLPAGRSTAGGHGHHGVQPQEIWMHGAGWTANSDPKPAKRSTPCARSSPNRSLVRLKGARGLDRFLLRGLEKVDGEWTLMAITHNIGKLHRASPAAS